MVVRSVRRHSRRACRGASVLAVPQRPEDVEEARDEQQPKEGRDESADERAQIPERTVFAAVEPDGRACRHLADRLAALRVADGVVQRRPCQVDQIRERAQKAREWTAAGGEDRQSEDERADGEADEERIDDGRAHALPVLRVPERLDDVDGGGHARVRLRWRGPVQRRRCVSRRAAVRFHACSLAALSYSGRDGSSNQCLVFA